MAGRSQALRSIWRVTGRYFRLYKLIFKLNLVQTVTYRASFLTMILVEVGYDIVTLVFFNVVYGNVDEIAGWDYHQVLFFVGFSIISSEIILGLFYIFGVSNLPKDVRRGDIDYTLTRPVNAQFMLTIGKPYVTSVLAVLSGVVISIYAYSQIPNQLEILPVILGGFMLLLGVIIGYSILTIAGATAFVFENANSVISLINESMLNFKGRPHTIYRGGIKLFLTIVLPAVFIASIPASMVVRLIEWEYVLLGIVIAMVSLVVSNKVWNRAIKLYSSAS